MMARRATDSGEPGWRGVAGSAARRAEAGKFVKYAERVGAAQVERVCVEAFGAFGVGASTVLRWIADAAYEGQPDLVKDLFAWKAACKSE